MKTLASTEVQDHFWRVIDMVNNGEPVAITQQGKPTLLLLRYEEGMSAAYHADHKNLESDTPTSKRVFGALRGRATVTPAFFEALPEGE